MTHSVLLVLNDEFDDMMFLSSQVVLEENGCDVIISSDSSKTVKGESSSVMTVDLENALSQDVEYSALIIVGGRELSNWELLKSTISRFHMEGKLIGTISDMVSLLTNANVPVPNLTNESFSTEGNIFILNDLAKCEEFIEEFSKHLQKS